MKSTWIAAVRQGGAEPPTAAAQADDWAPSMGEKRESLACLSPTFASLRIGTLRSVGLGGDCWPAGTDALGYV